jgi:uncharacterized membrane protein YciS (DUF1049 family)
MTSQQEARVSIHIKGDVMGLSGMVLSAISTVAGAIMYWATTAQTSVVAQQHGFRLSTLGVILMIAGAVGFVISLIVFASSRRSPSAPARSMDREVVDSSGNRTVVHERQN